MMRIRISFSFVYMSINMTLFKLLIWVIYLKISPAEPHADNG